MAFGSSNFQLVITYKIVCFIVFFPIVIFRIVSCKFHTFENNACTLLITYLTTCVHHHQYCLQASPLVSSHDRMVLTAPCNVDATPNAGPLRGVRGFAKGRSEGWSNPPHNAATAREPPWAPLTIQP